MFTIIAGVSLLVCVMFASAWVRSLFASDFFEMVRFRSYIMGHTLPGKLQVRVCLNYDPRHFWGAQSPKWYVNHSVLMNTKDWETERLPEAKFDWRGGGFILTGMPNEYEPEFGTMVWFFVGFPYWFAMLPTALLPAWWFRLWQRRGRQQTLGLCPHCGYDLRATPERCPECGKSPMDGLSDNK